MVGVLALMRGVLTESMYSWHQYVLVLGLSVLIVWHRFLVIPSLLREIDSAKLRYKKKVEEGASMLDSPEQLTNHKSNAERNAVEAAIRVDELATLQDRKETALKTVNTERLQSIFEVEKDAVSAAEDHEMQRKTLDVERDKQDVARRAHIATLELAWSTQIKTIDAARRAELATLEAARHAELATLEAARRADCATASLEAVIRERRRAMAYTNHEIKNRLIAIAELCHTREGPVDAARVHETVTEAIEIIVKRGVMADLASGSYTPRLENVDIVELLKARVARYQVHEIEVVPPPAGDAATFCKSLRLDPLLLGVVIDNLLSNSLKYGHKTVPPRFEVSAEMIESDHADSSVEDSQASSPPASSAQQDVRCRVKLILHNAAGTGHARLLELGEDELNRVAAAEGERVEMGVTAGSCGDGFPMALECAHKLKGTLWLSLSEEGVTTTFLLPETAVGAKTPKVDIDRIARLSFAVVDDSGIICKMLARVANSIFSATPAPPIIAGATRESIESFVADVVSADTDVVFVDQNFGTVAPSMSGTGIVSEIRTHDQATSAQPRLIFIVSANDTKDDRAIYAFAGADDCLAKNNLNTSSMRELIHRHVAMGFARVVASP